MKEYLLPKKHWPKYLLDFKEIEAIFIGGCILGFKFNPFKDGTVAFAHSHTINEYGLICIPSKNMINNRMLMLHEVAHLIARSGHTDKWRRTLLKIGGVLSPFKVGNQMSIDYHKKTKK